MSELMLIKEIVIDLKDSNNNIDYKNNRFFQ